MEDIKKLLNKGKKSLEEDGLKEFLTKTKNWTVYQFKKDKRKETVKDILFINGCGLPHPERYRVAHQIEQLEANGLTADQVFYTMVKPEMVKFYRGIVIFRCPFTKQIGELIKKAHYFNKAVFFDIDDLVIDKKYTDNIEFVKKMDSDDKRSYDDGVIRMGKTMKKCDYIITTTGALARELQKYGKEVFVNRNVASEEMVKLSTDAVRRSKKNGEEITIGYLSGSITHNPDFELVKPALIKIMDEFPNTKLLVMGYLDIPDGFERFRKRIITKSFSNWKKLPEIIAELDINLAPIEETVFNEAKSENKWTEAALCRVPTVASDFGAFKEIIKDGENGLLCKNSEEWYEKIKMLIEQPAMRDKIAKKANAKALKEYITTYSGLPLARFIESKLAKNIAFVLPSTNISGGVNVVLKHCEILRRNGWDSMVINMDLSDDNFVGEDGEVNVVSGVRHDFKVRFDGMVATLFTTLAFIRSYPCVKKKFYLVQNFETDFNDYGSPMRKEANATYNDITGVKYLTISKWCQKWLQEDFGQRAKYAPNGIDSGKFKYRERKFDKRKIRILVEGNSDDYYKNVDESFKVIEKLEKDKYEIVYLSYQGEPKKWYHVDEFYNRIPHDEVGKIYDGCDILLKTSILESFSYPPLEMMATGGYVVAVPNAGNKEYLEDGKNCLFYEQGNLDAAVEKIERLTSNADLRAKLKIGAKKTVEGRDWEDIEDKILDLYQ